MPIYRDNHTLAETVSLQNTLDFSFPGLEGGFRRDGYLHTPARVYLLGWRRESGNNTNFVFI